MSLLDRMNSEGLGKDFYCNRYLLSALSKHRGEIVGPEAEAAFAKMPPEVQDDPYAASCLERAVGKERFKQLQSALGLAAVKTPDGLTPAKSINDDDEDEVLLGKRQVTFAISGSQRKFLPPTVVQEALGVVALAAAAHQREAPQSLNLTLHDGVASFRPPSGDDSQIKSRQTSELDTISGGAAERAHMQISMAEARLPFERSIWTSQEK
eukprot:gnl/MRDRNA2_/MRDRNA2_22826_c0_seq1.p1 gnl/MRDRNA2_/MRDRNA2_22826_c0~~gnl/MRDRNA2_/MRDRNA2_22826_c0_seq1.p1  ORF type:complete len:217 (-),score=46.57 gnl/MRDRNA2_/MRDRNA2_22826_c0_seq1:116-745(-)